MSVAERSLDPVLEGSRGVGAQIQPFAALIAVTTDWDITHISTNIGEFLDFDASVLGHTLDQVFLDEAVHEIRGVLNATAGHSGAGRLFGCDLRRGYPEFDLTVHEYAHGFIIEIERGEPRTRIDDIGLVRGLSDRVRQSGNSKEAADKAARSIRALTGFDRVAVCQLHENGRATVLSEASMPGITSLLESGLSAQEISAIGDDSHQQLVADIDAVPVAIISRRDSAPLDLQPVISVAPTEACIKVLRAQDAKAALIIPILQGGTVTGLVLCHHSKPLCAGFRMRALVDLFVDLYAYEFVKVQDYAARQ